MRTIISLASTAACWALTSVAVLAQAQATSVAPSAPTTPVVPNTPHKPPTPHTPTAPTAPTAPGAPTPPARAAKPPPNTPTTTQAATPGPQAAPSKGEIKAMREFKMLDFNGDGQLSRNEVRLFPRLAAAFDGADTNKNGYVSYEEVRVYAAKYRAERDRQRAQEAATAPVSAPPAKR